MMRFQDGLRGLHGIDGGFAMGGIIMQIAGILLLAALVFCTVVCIKYLAAERKKKALPPLNTAIDGSAVNILNEKYANGEIGEEEYLKKKAEICKP